MKKSSSFQSKAKILKSRRMSDLSPIKTIFTSEKLNKTKEIKDFFKRFDNDIIANNEFCINTIPLFQIESETKPCVEEPKRVCKYNKTLGSGSINGEAYKSCFVNEKHYKICFALKQIPMKEIPETLDLQSKKLRSSEVYIEMISLILCNYLRDQQICPNLPYSYKFFYCKKCTFSNPELIKSKSNKPCLVSANELADLGDAREFFKIKNLWKIMDQGIPFFDIFYNVLFQIAVGLYALQTQFNMSHHDLHMGNVLFESTGNKPRDKKYIKYTIQKKSYYIQDLGFKVIIWDFGYAVAPQKLHDPAKEGILAGSYLGFKYSQNIPRFTADLSRFLHILVYKLDSILENDFPGFPEEEKQIEFYNFLDRQQKDGTVVPPFLFIDKMHNLFKKKQNNVISSWNLDKKVKNIRKDLEDITKFDNQLYIQEIDGSVERFFNLLSEKTLRNSVKLKYIEKFLDNYRIYKKFNQDDSDLETLTVDLLRQ